MSWVPDALSSIRIDLRAEQLVLLDDGALELRESENFLRNTFSS